MMLIPFASSWDTSSNGSVGVIEKFCPLISYRRVQFKSNLHEGLGDPQKDGSGDGEGEHLWSVNNDLETLNYIIYLRAYCFEQIEHL